MGSYSRIGALLILATAMAGCGGGGSDDETVAGAPPPEDPPPSNPPPSDPPPNGKPTISGDPATAITVDLGYGFLPSAQDPDGDALSFSIANKPGWASFDTQTGEISGRPNVGDVGQYRDIRVSVSDGTDSATLAFDLEVAGSATGAISLQWLPPSENTDGSALLDLAGINIYFGQQEGLYPNKIELNGAGVTSYVLNNLTAGDYYFVSTAVNSQGVESPFSNMIVRAAN